MSAATTRVTKAEVTDLLSFLGANVDVARHDGEIAKADKYREFQDTVRGLVALVGELPTSHDDLGVAAAAANRRRVAEPGDAADTHFYIDISGSIRLEDNFDVIAAEVDRVKTAAGIAGRPVTAYFTPFTHRIVHGEFPLIVTESSPTRAELKRHLSQIPLSGGGTDFQVVWKRINSTEERSRRSNVIITDLQWFTDVETLRREQPANVSYAVIPEAPRYAINAFENLLRDADRHHTTPIRFY